MTKTSFTELRKHAKMYFDKVEKGETVQVIRHGKVIARIVPPDQQDRTPIWKTPRVKLKIPGVSVSEMIIQERGESM